MLWIVYGAVFTKVLLKDLLLCSTHGLVSGDFYSFLVSPLQDFL